MKLQFKAFKNIPILLNGIKAIIILEGKLIQAEWLNQIYSGILIKEPYYKRLSLAYKKGFELSLFLAK
jgi:hypothetical protein